MNTSFTIETVPTPAMIWDGPIVRKNIDRLAQYASSHKLRIRPHTKTHKSSHLSKLQIEAGALGLTVAKAGEAEVMSGVSDDSLLAFPVVDPWRAERIAELANRVTIRVATDSSYGVEMLSKAARKVNSTIRILVDVDVGLGRTGVQTAQQSLELAQFIDKTANVRLDGIMFYPGHIWESVNSQPQALAKVSLRLQEVLDVWARQGLKASIVSGGSTPTAYLSHLIPQATEIRPGTYVFNDMNTLRGGYCQLEDCAARIVCTVVSTAIPGQIVIDAGSKTLTSDRCIPALDSGYGYVVEFPQAKIIKLSEEHGQIDISACSEGPKPGQRVTIIPNHICPCVNLQGSIWWKDSSDLLSQVEIEARGKIV